MNYTAQAIIQATRQGKNLKIGEVQTIPSKDGKRATILLHGFACMELDTGKGLLTIMGNTLPTKKSCRLINAFLSEFSIGKTMTRNGTWFHESPSGERIIIQKEGCLLLPLRDRPAFGE